MSTPDDPMAWLRAQYAAAARRSQIRRFEPGQKTWTVVVHTPVLGDRVSVRLSTERGTMFGIAAVVEREMPRLAGVIARTTLVGVSPLGQRADCT